MTDWLRVLGWSLLSLLAIVAGWFLRSRYALAKFRMSEEQQQHITESRVGWWGDQKKNDQSRVDRKC